MSSHLLRPATIAVASLATLASALPASAAPNASSVAAKHPHYATRAALATRWQASQLTRGRIHNGQYGFDDWGLTVDTGLMLAAAGTSPAALTRLTRVVKHHYPDYTLFKGHRYAGSVGKTLLFVRVVRKNPQKFGGVNVRRQLLNLRVRSGPNRGRFSDSVKPDSSNVLSQSYGVLGLARTGGVPQSAVNFLLDQRCPNGFFRLYPVSGQTCKQSQSAPDIDATSLAIQALVSARQHGAAVSKRSIGESARWLVNAQRRNGSFGGGLTTENSNSNSTGLAANALVATGHTMARLRAASWVSTLQITRSRARRGPARTDIGAVAYRPAALHRALKSGIGVKKRDQFRRATPQAYFALAPAPFATLLSPRQ